MRASFIPLEPPHLPTLHRWLQLPHVREFWDDGDRTPQQVQAHYFGPERDVAAFLMVLDGENAGYVQAYEVDATSDYAAWRSETGETWGIDLFIGEERWLGRGLAAGIVRDFIAHWQQLRPALRRVLIDPETRNERARHVYKKAGFVALGRVEMEGKELVMMGVNTQ